MTKTSFVSLMLRFVVIAALFTTMFVTTGNASTSQQYSISDHYVRAILNPDGSVFIDEFITYRFYPDYVGYVEKRIDISRATAITELEVFAVSVVNPEQNILDANLTPFTLVEGLIDGQTGTYTTDIIDFEQKKFKEIKMNIPTGAGEQTIAFRYRLDDLIYIYQDTAVLLWEFIGTGNLYDINNIEVEIVLPDGALQEDIKIFVQGSPDNNAAIVSDSLIRLWNEQLNPGEFLEAMLLLPTPLIAQGRKIVDNYVLVDMIERGESWVDQADEIRMQRERRSQAIILAGLLLLLVGLCVGIYFYVHYFKRASRPAVQKEYQDKMPDYFYTPAELSVLINRSRIMPADMIATLMDMVIKGNLNLEADKTQGQKAFKLSLMEDCHVGRLEPHEEYLINWLLKEVGNGIVFSTSDIKQIAANPTTKNRFLSKFDTWSRVVIKQAATWNFDQKSTKSEIKMTPLGAAHYSEWMGFKEFLVDSSRQNKTLSLVEWEKYLIYSIPLGEVQNVIAQLSSMFQKEAFDDERLTLLRRSNFDIIECWFECLWE